MCIHSMDKRLVEKLLISLLDTEAPASNREGIKIVILQRGWVYIGRYHEEGDYGVLTNAHCIRRWGTTEGLGQLAKEGKQVDTKIESTGTVRFHRLSAVAMIDCNESVWNNL